jgi:hypothetical protein
LSCAKVLAGSNIKRACLGLRPGASPRRLYAFSLGGVHSSIPTITVTAQNTLFSYEI